MGPDVLLLVPFEPDMNMLFDQHVRRVTGARIYMPLMEAHAKLEAHMGMRISLQAEEDDTIFGAPPVAHRSLGAVAMATHLEAAELAWEVCDPGVTGLSYWRKRLEAAKRNPPKVVGISTTFVMKTAWLRTLCRMVRRALPTAKVVVGGYYYSTNAEGFLSLDADVFCIGEGEQRLVDIVRALCAKDPVALGRIPGIYIRRPTGGLDYTGRAEALELARLPTPDWTLASRIDPPVELARHTLMQPVETQRGCVFKCEFCTFRTLAELSVMPADRAVEEILGSALAHSGMINLADATASVPHARWLEVLRDLADRGGCPLPISAFARVADIDDECADLMARANVRLLFIGQESGDQSLLNAMKKGTKVSQIRPALEACARHGIGTYFSFIHGFPGETAESLAATRQLIVTLNQGHEERPVCFTYALNPFQLYDFATVTKHDALQDAEHYLSYATSEFNSQQIGDEVLTTMFEAAKAPAAPIPMEILNLVGLSRAAVVFSGPERYRAFHFLKTVYRGIGLFAEQLRDGVKPPQAQLREVERALERDRRLLPTGASALRARARGVAKMAVARRLKHEWRSEQGAGAGPLTRALLVWLLSKGLGSLPDALDETGRVLQPDDSAPQVRDVQSAAEGLISAALAKRKRPAIRQRSTSSL